MSDKIQWKCPRCGAKANAHGKGGRSGCSKFSGRYCDGFLCVCWEYGIEDEDPDHGLLLEKPCRHARCGHCDWGGVFPPKPRALVPWEKKALKEGWTMPAKRKEELERSESSKRVQLGKKRSNKKMDRKKRA